LGFKNIKVTNDPTTFNTVTLQMSMDNKEMTLEVVYIPRTSVVTLSPCPTEGDSGK
jgi:hypothetical protein